MREKDMTPIEIEYHSESEKESYIQALHQTVEEDGISTAISLSAAPEAQQCDFCLCPNPVWGYPCEDFVQYQDIVIDCAKDHTVRHTINSVGDWGACDACHLIIETGDVAALITRILTQQDYSLGCEFAIRLITHQMTEFFKLRKGPAVPCPKGL